MIVGDTYVVDELQTDGTFKETTYEVVEVRDENGATITVSKQI